MKRTISASAFFPLLPVCLSLVSVGVRAQSPLQFSFDWPKLAQTVVRQLDLQPGERVLLLRHPGQFAEFVPHFRYNVIKAGGIDLGALEVLAPPYPKTWDAELVQRSGQDSQAAVREFLQAADVVVKMPGALPPAPAYLAIQDLLREGSKRTVHFHWEGAMPLFGESLPPQPVIDAVYQKAVMETDYETLAKIQRRFESAMRDQVVHVTTPEGTDLTFRIGERPVTRQDGDASARRAQKGRNLIDREVELPAGAIRVAPLEESVQGVIVFPISRWNGFPVRNLRLQFADGKVVDYEAESGVEQVKAEIEAAGESGRSFREFALGFNPLLAIPERDAWIPYYGYGAGVVRLSLGDNTELGGAVGGGYVRWNFFVNATVQVGDRIWVKGGKLTVPGG